MEKAAIARIGQIKAFIVDCGGEYGGQVYFAATRGQAKILAVNEEGTDITAVVSCRRKPEWDVFTPGPVPIKVRMEDGWWFECPGCGQQVIDDGECYHGANGEPCNSEPIFVGTQEVYCCQGCKDAEELREAERKVEEVKRRREAMAAFAITWPGVKPSRVDVLGRRKALMAFRVPGAGSEVFWEMGDCTVQVIPGDLQAWYAWEDSRLGPIMAWEDDGGKCA